MLLAFFLSATHVKGYDCSQLKTNNHRCPIVNGPSVSYPTCLVTEFSASAFIQCADLKGPNAPQFTLTQAGDHKTVSVLELLSQALDRHSCDSCPLAGKIRRLAAQNGLGNFATSLCNLNPSDAGMCCLARCINGINLEHSIEVACSYTPFNLMNSPLVPDTCENSNGQNGGGTGNNGDTTDYGGAEPASSTISEDFPVTSSYFEAAASTTLPTFFSTTSSPVAAGSATSTTPLPSPAQETPNVGAGSKRWRTLTDRVISLSFALLPAWVLF